MNRADWKPEFAHRFRRHEEELHSLYDLLYHGNAAAYGSFVGMLYSAWENRPEDLARLDRAREADPEWYRRPDLVGMEMDVRAFAGSIQGMLEKIGYLSDCGVRCLFLRDLKATPRDPGDDGGEEWMQSGIGSPEALTALAGACHERGISLGLDYSLNHTSVDHPWARRARAGEKEYQDRYFFYDSADLPSAYGQTRTPPSLSAPPSGFTWCEETKKIVMTTFHPRQWDLNYAHPAVFHAMVFRLFRLCDQGVDIIQLKDAPYIWKALGTSCQNLRQAHALLRILRMACEIVCPGTLLLGDVNLEPVQAAAYFGQADHPECHLLCDSACMPVLWHTVATRDPRLLAHQLERLFARPKEDTFLHFLRCRDEIDWTLDYAFLRTLGQQEFYHRLYLNDYLTGKWPGSLARGALYREDPRRGESRLCGATASLCGMEAAREMNDEVALQQSIRLDILLHALLFTLSGVPCIYSGDEIGQVNDDSFRGDSLKEKDARYLHRGPMNWDQAALRNQPGTAPEAIFSALRRMEKLRGQSAAFDPRADCWLLPTQNDHILGIGRYFGEEKLLALFNFDHSEQTACLQDPEEYTDLFTGEKKAAVAVTLPACGFQWLLKAY